VFPSYDTVLVLIQAAYQLLYPDLSYRKALEVHEISLFSQRRNNLWKSYFKKLLNPENKLNELIPNKREDYNLRNDQHINLINCKTTRFSKSFIPSSIVSYNDSF
jgi:hypothetical protein